MAGFGAASRPSGSKLPRHSCFAGPDVPVSHCRPALTVSQPQVYRIRLLRVSGPPLIREVVEFMSFTRRQILGGLAGLVVVGVGAGGASRYWLGKMAQHLLGRGDVQGNVAFALLFVEQL